METWRAVVCIAARTWLDRRKEGHIVERAPLECDLVGVDCCSIVAAASMTPSYDPVKMCLVPPTPRVAALEKLNWTRPSVPNLPTASLASCLMDR